MTQREKIILTNSMYRVLRPIILISKAFCLLPFAVKQHDTEWWILWSWWRLFTALLMISIIVTFSLYGLMVNYQLEEIHKIRFGKFSGALISIIDVSLLVSTFLLSCFSSLINYKHLRKYFNSLMKVDILLTFRPSSVEAKACSTLILVSAISTFLVLATDLCIWSNIVSKNTNIYFYVILQLPCYFYYVFMVVTAVSYYLLVKCISVRLKFLNSSLKNDYFRRKLFINSYLSDISTLKVNKSRFQYNFLASEINSEHTRKCKINYSEGYELLVESNVALNNYYGFIILILLFGNLLHLMITPYDLYIEVLHKKYSFILLQTLWMIGHILRLLLIVEPCSTAESEVKKMCRLICKLLNLKIDMEFRNQLRILLSLLDHCPIKFTTLDMVSVDRYLLTSIAGGVTTYLVVLIQFTD